MLTSTEMGIFEYTDQKLRAHYQTNEQFNVDLARAVDYYTEKLNSFIKPTDKERVEQELYQSVKSQIFNGYFMVHELLRHEDTQIEDEWFQQSIGMIAQQLPDMLRNITNDNIDEIITNSALKNMASWLVLQYEGIYPLLMDISLNTACLGAKWGFIDEAEKRGITNHKPQIDGYLAYIDDVTFIDPQTYITCDIKTESSEVWTIISSAYNGLDKIGDVTIIKHTGNEGTYRYFMNINMKKSLTLDEQQDLINNLGMTFLVATGIERPQLSLYAASVEEFYEINQPTA